MDDAGPSTPVSTPKGLSETSKKPPRRSSAVMRSSALHERSVQSKAKEPRNSLFRARKVPLENKMGVAPSGWMAEVGFALQRGIADAEAAVVAGERISQAAEWAYSAVRDGSSITCSSAEFSVGRTRVLAHVAAELVPEVAVVHRVHLHRTIGASQEPHSSDTLVRC